MKKYYDQIVSLIKEHRKYPGCEDILEDIVEDVYAHANVVLNSVTNESVVSSYLSKIVSTSMITVPKRLGVTTSRLQRSTDTEALIEELTVSVSDTETEADETYSAEYDSLTNITENDFAGESELTSLDTAYENTEELDLSSQGNAELQEITDIEIGDEDLAQANAEEIIEEKSDEYIPAEEQEQENKDETETDEKNQDNIVLDRNEPEVDKTLVDKMINGIASDENSAVQEEDLLEQIDTELVSENTVAEVSDEIVTLTEEEPDETEEISELDLDIDDTPAGAAEFVSQEQEEILSEDGEISELSDDFAEPLESLESDEPEYTGEIVETIEDNEAEPVEPIVETVSEDKAISGLSAYNAFVFTPKSEEYDLSEILPEIDALAAKYPDLKVLEVFKLKYYEKLSVSEIAKQLEMTNSDILKTLNELMYLVKE